jgi:hypothetical protein
VFKRGQHILVVVIIVILIVLPSMGA